MQFKKGSLETRGGVYYKIKIHPYLMDHCFQGKVVFPAVAAMQIMADFAKSNIQINHARFDKFLYIPFNKDYLDAYIDICSDEADNIIVKLKTKATSKLSNVFRFKENAAACFPKLKEDIKILPFSEAAILNGETFKISAAKLYQELVPFGKSFQNICDSLTLNEHGAIAFIYTPFIADLKDDLLGSPFTLDSAFHAACAWSQRFYQIAAFPTGFEKRIIFNKTLTGNKYIARIMPVKKENENIIFDIWIYNDKGVLFEAVIGLIMKDVSGGKLKPPQWVIYG